MHMSRHPQIIRRRDCYPGVSLLCALGERYLPEGKEYLVLSFPLVCCQSVIDRLFCCQVSQIY